MKEIWKVYKIITCANQNYKKGDIIKVSNCGRVKCNNKIIELKPQQNGYKVLCRVPLHRIVAELFIPNPYNLPCVDHIDGNRLNNMAVGNKTNLRWVTYTENNNNPITRKKMSEAAKGKIPWNKKKEDLN